MRVYKYYDAKYGRMALEKCRLKLSTFQGLNDPFEFNSPAFGTREDRGRFKNVIEKCMSGKGLLCFSKSRRNPVMWSHYADSHRGICLGFDVEDRLLTAIRYVDRRPKNKIRYDKIQCSENEELFEKCTFTKFSHWKYEEEMRAFFKVDEEKTPNSKFFFEPFSEKIILREVCLGMNYESADRNLHTSIVKSGVAVRTMRMAFNEFAIVCQQDKKYAKTI